MEKLAYRGAKNKDKTVSGYYDGTYFFIGDNAIEKAKKFNDNIYSIDYSNAKLYDINNDKDSNKLKRMSSEAGFDVVEDSGYPESEYLKKWKYDGIKKMLEVIIFDTDKFDYKPITLTEKKTKGKVKLILSQLQLDKIKNHKKN